MARWQHKLIPTLLLTLGVVMAPLYAMKRLEVDFEYVSEKAETLAKKPYRPSKLTTPSELQELNYEEYRKIRFEESQTVWMEEGLPFQLQFFHLGYLFNNSVRLNEFTATHAQRIPYRSEFFDLSDLQFNQRFKSSLDYAGFKVLYPLNSDALPYDEVVSFLGASYFRALGEDMSYGISARGVAINGGLSQPEEFPRFVEFWLGKPKGNSLYLTIYSLLDGPSLTGAYQFEIHPNGTTRMNVKAKLFFRDSVESLGVAPLTSMFWHGENGPYGTNDYRPESHDSDGLLIDTKKERLWRPLSVGDKTKLSYFKVDELVGFGLFQRDRNFDHYQDLAAQYHRRPSVWVDPLGDWGKGHVKLIELPPNKEFEDNIVAFWEPDERPEKGESLELRYTLYWTKKPALTVELMPRALSTRIGSHLAEEDVTVFIIEFGGLGEGQKNTEAVPEALASVSENATLSFSTVEWNEFSGTWRVSLNVKRSDDVATGSAIELRCQLKFPDGAHSETWTYQWTP